MEPLPSPEIHLNGGEAARMLDVADAAILEGLADRPPPVVTLDSLPDRLRRRVGSFVTLTVAGELNGCIGHVEGVDVLGREVAHLAWSAAFADPRLPALEWSDRDALTIAVSLLSPPRPIPAGSRQELLDRLSPGIDGLVIRSGRRQGLFLPSVWEQLRDAGTFVDELFRKAGLIPGRWPAGTEAFRFVTRSYRRQVDAARGVRASR